MYSTRYGQPCMTNIPGELGRAIFNQILNSPKPDYDAMEKKARALEKEMLKVREQEIAQEKSARPED